MQANPGMKLGRWTLRGRLGGGGNGRVWLAISESGEEIAIKTLAKNGPNALKRFRDEVAILKRCSDIEGILPVLDERIPETPGSELAWFGMPRAQGAADVLAEATIFEKAKAIVQIAKTVAALHARDIGHRDIKPANILHRNGRYYLADFGLVTFAEKEDLTGAQEDVGSRWTMAPEMRRFPKDADPRPADVFSLAKTLWILLTREEKGFEGQYNHMSDTSLRKHLPRIHLTGLESLLTDATAHTPELRPTMNEFATRLKDWITEASDYRLHNPLDWDDAQRRLFPISVPIRASWTSLESITSTLSFLGRISSLGHLMFPKSGGFDLTGADRAREDGCIELWVQGFFVVAKPVRLMFESFGHEPQWNYFRLEIEKLPPTGLYNLAEGATHEDLIDAGGQYHIPGTAPDDEDQEKEAPIKKRKRVFRFFNDGAFLVFQKTAIYNKIPATYRGKHSSISADEFRNIVEGAATTMSKLGIRRHVQTAKNSQP
ncbi:serine/threonine protein kinase [Corallococcus exiguus]|uniref:serine/threonine protein kinase n=1 Tax=Corallococcus exiguus TaxID=83462 RepID=UPI003211AD60